MHESIMNAALNQQRWKQANLRLVTKILNEFLYEEMLTTEQTAADDGSIRHQLTISPELGYTFTARRRIFGNWNIDSSSIQRHAAGCASSNLSVHQLITDTYKIIGISGLTLGHLLRELNNTLVADCHIDMHNTCSEKIILLPNHELEGHMHGHPWFVINKGRMGFSYQDYLDYAPEMRQRQKLSWLAVNRQHAQFHAHAGFEYDALIANELSSTDIDRFNAMLAEQQLVPANFYFMPVHDWQWQHQIVTLFAEDIVNKDIVYLGSGSDEYLPTQSVRTFSNASMPDKLQVKLPISIFNTAVYRGLPSERTRLAPQLTTWLKQKYHADPFLQNQCRLVLLGEVATIDYAHRVYNPLPGIPYQYKELLGALWRENIYSCLKEGESALTMAAIIHVDAEEKPLVCALIEKSGLSISDWLAQFFAVTMPPLLHWLYQYGVVFSPHGENTLLILDEQFRPAGLAVKDFIDDVNITKNDFPELSDLPETLQQVLLKADDEYITQFIHTGLFVVLYRYLSDILATYAGYQESCFWRQVQSVIQDYQHTHPELAERFRKFDLLRASFKKLCLNRLRLLSVGYADYADRPKVDTLELMANPVNTEILDTWARQGG